MIDENQIPVFANVAGIEKLKLTPEEVFVLSRINGNLTIREINQIIGFSSEKTVSCVQKLIDNGVISLKMKEVKVKKVTSGSPTIMQELDREDLDPQLANIPRSQRNRISLLAQNLPTMNFFEILEVTPSAEAEEIQKNYLRLVKEFHPDSVPGVFGIYKERLESIFQKIQLAYQEIHPDNKRAAYLHSLFDGRRSKTGEEIKPKYEYKVPRKGPKTQFADAESQFEMGVKEEKKGNLAAAMNFYQMALNLSPQKKTFEEAFLRVRKRIRDGY